MKARSIGVLFSNFIYEIKTPIHSESVGIITNLLPIPDSDEINYTPDVDQLNDEEQEDNGVIAPKQDHEEQEDDEVIPETPESRESGSDKEN